MEKQNRNVWMTEEEGAESRNVWTEYHNVALKSIWLDGRLNASYSEVSSA